MIDEIPGAYKDIDEVMANQNDLVAVEHYAAADSLCKRMIHLYTPVVITG